MAQRHGLLNATLQPYPGEYFRDLDLATIEFAIRQDGHGCLMRYGREDLSFEWHYAQRTGRASGCSSINQIACYCLSTTNQNASHSSRFVSFPFSRRSIHREDS